MNQFQDLQDMRRALNRHWALERGKQFAKLLRKQPTVMIVLNLVVDK